MDEILTVNFDGGSRGNPGTAGIGVVLKAQDGTVLAGLGRYIGRATNNAAEYMALIVGLREAAKMGAKRLSVLGDSELIIKQMRGEYRVKNPGLKDLYEQAITLVKTFQEVRFVHNLREHNSLADKLANRAMDRKADVTDVDDIPPQAADRGASPRQASAPSVIQSLSVLSCPDCGCELEIKKPPKVSGSFICPCGGALRAKRSGI